MDSMYFFSSFLDYILSLFREDFLGLLKRRSFFFFFQGGLCVSLYKGLWQGIMLISSTAAWEEREFLWHIEINGRMRKPQPAFGKIKILQRFNKLLMGRNKAKACLKDNKTMRRSMLQLIRWLKSRLEVKTSVQGPIRVKKSHL